MKKSIFAIIIIIAIIAACYFLFQHFQNNKNREVEPIGNNMDPEEKLEEINISSELGLDVEILEHGSGIGAKNGNKITVHYTGTLLDGTKFDSSVDRGQPFQFGLGAGQVIQGWDLGVKGMKVGEKRKLTIAPELGYGDRGMGSIPPNSILIFEVELLGIN